MPSKVNSWAWNKEKIGGKLDNSWWKEIRSVWDKITTVDELWKIIWSVTNKKHPIHRRNKAFLADSKRKDEKMSNFIERKLMQWEYSDIKKVLKGTEE